MQIKTIDFKNPTLSPKQVVFTLGCFDGIHLGHQKLIEEVQKKAQQNQVKSCLCVFDPHPFEILKPQENFERLLTIKELKGLLHSYNLDYFCTIPFDLKFSQMSAQQFVFSFVKEHFNPYQMIVGYDFSFGHQRQGSFSFLQNSAQKLGFQALQVSPVLREGQAVSSSRIKKEVSLGHMKQAQSLLGHAFFIEALVVQGEGRGRQIGFPTANLQIEKGKKLPKNGVYSCRVFKDGQGMEGVMNVGYRPTFTSKKQVFVEVHLIEKDLNLYGSTLKVEILDFIREERGFSNSFELQKQIQKDIQKALKNF